MKPLFLVLFLLVQSVCFATYNHAAADSCKPKKSVDDFDEKLAKPELVYTGDSTGKYYQLAMKEYYLYKMHGFEHRKKVFEWQYLSSIVIFFIVVSLVLCGIYFSWLQFHAFKKGAGLEPTELSASATEVKVSSPVLGVIILIISFMFFYLYLHFVYPISEIF